MSNSLSLGWFSFYFHVSAHICDVSVPVCQRLAPAAVVLMMLRNICAAAVTTAPILCPVYVRCPAGPTA